MYLEITFFQLLILALFFSSQPLGATSRNIKCHDGVAILAEPEGAAQAKKILASKLNWPSFQIKALIKVATPDQIKEIVSGRPFEGETTVYFGSQTPFNREKARESNIDEVTNPITALEVFATSFGKSEGYVNILDKIPRKGLRGRMKEGDTMPYEQAQQVLSGVLDGKGIADYVQYSVPSKVFREIINTCCKNDIISVSDPSLPGVQVKFLNPAEEAKVHEKILKAVQSEGDKYTTPR